jgi:hypothetical protein
MLTPAGKECRYFYGDYHRGRKVEECRLLESINLDWMPYLCEKCPIPDILLANSCEHLEFRPRLERQLLILKPQIKISSYCKKSKTIVDEPRIGCGQCHPLLNVFTVPTDESDPSDRSR